MALEWFKVDASMVGHPKVEHLERELGVADGVGIIIRLWSWTTRYAPTGNVTGNAAVTLGRAVSAPFSSPLRGAQDAAGNAQVTLAALVASGWLEAAADGGYVVHDWETTQPEHAASADRKAEQNRERQRRFKERHRAEVTQGNASVTPSNAPRGEEKREEKKEEERPMSGSSPTDPGPDTPASAKISVEAQRVFEHWVRVRKKPPTTLFSPERKRKVLARFADKFTVDQLCKAIDGVASSPHHRGENDRNTVFDDLELICRDAKHVEQFLAFALSRVPAVTRARPPTITRPKSAEEIDAERNQQARDAVEKRRREEGKPG